MGGRYLIKNNSWITSIIKGKPRRERPIQSYKKQVMLDLGKLSYKELKKVAMDRVKWKNISSLNQTTDGKKRV